MDLDSVFLQELSGTTIWIWKKESDPDSIQDAFDHAVKLLCHVAGLFTSLPGPTRTGNSRRLSNIVTLDRPPIRLSVYEHVLGLYYTIQNDFEKSCTLLHNFTMSFSDPPGTCEQVGPHQS